MTTATVQRRTIMTLRLSEREEGVAAALSSVRPASKSEMLMESGDLIKPCRPPNPRTSLLLPTIYLQQSFRVLKVITIRFEGNLEL